MLKRLRRKFIAITMLLVGLVLAGVLGSSLFSSALTQRGIVTQILERALSDGVAAATIGDTSGEQSAELMLAVVVDVTPDGTIVDRTSFVANVPEQTLVDEGVPVVDDGAHAPNEYAGVPQVVALFQIAFGHLGGGLFAKLVHAEYVLLAR